MKPVDSEDAISRRGLLRTGAGAVTGTALAGATGSASAQMDAYGGYLSEEGTWEGMTTDATAVDSVSVTVGAAGNGGSLAFAPAALLVEPGTTVSWEWSGEGGAHNVVHDQEVDDEASEQVFRSGGPVDSEEEVFEFTFEEEGVYPYFCLPHKSLQMKGVVVVGEDNAETDLVAIGAEGEGLNMTAVFGGAASVGIVSFAAIAAYRELLEPEPSDG